MWARASSSSVATKPPPSDAIFGSGSPLEQQRRRRQPDQFVAVAGADERDGSVGAADAADDGAEHVGEFGADHEQPFGVGLGRSDLQQRHQFAGAGQPVLDQAVVAEFEQFLHPDAGVAEHLDDRPRPERVFLVAVEQSWFAGVGIAHPDVVRGRGAAGRSG